MLEHRRCLGCGCAFVATALSPEDLAAAYSGSDWARYYAEIGVENANKMHAAVRDLDHLPRGARIIDIGTGNGAFLAMLHKAGFTHLAGHEIEDGGQRIEGIDFYFDADYRSVPSGAFDCISLLDVVEHVPDASRLFAACHRIAAPSGLIYFHTPVVTHMDRIMHALLSVPGVRKLAFTWLRGRTSIYHLQNYTPSALRALLERAGFCDVKIKAKNELSWPVSMYVRTYIVEKYGLPRLFQSLLTPILYPFLRSDLLNPNKAIVSARKSDSA